MKQKFLNLINKVKDFLMKPPLSTHLYSFAKTYATVFLTIYLKEIVEGVNDDGNLMLGNMAVIIPAAKWSFIAVLRNVYKIITE